MNPLTRIALDVQALKGFAIILSWLVVSWFASAEIVDVPWIARLAVFVLTFSLCLIFTFVGIEIGRMFRDACSALEDRRQ